MDLRILAFLACLQFAVSETYDKVSITYFYQARCPFCMEYIEKDLYPGYKKLSKYIHFEAFPIVNNINDKGKITCSHGENECFITKAQACVFERPGVTEARKVEFLHCSEAKALEGNDVTDADIKACVESVLKDIVTYDTVQTCMTGNEYASVLRGYAARADGSGVQFVPWVAFFGKFDEYEYQQLRSNFVYAICAKLKNPPDVCNEVIGA